MYKVSNDKATTYANSIGGVSGDDSLASLWKNHFSALYNAVTDCGSKENFYSKLNVNADGLDCSFNIDDILNAVHSQKKGKAAGPDGLAMEAYIYGSRRLFIHLSILFNLCITHCYT